MKNLEHLAGGLSFCTVPFRLNVIPIEVTAHGMSLRRKNLSVEAYAFLFHKV
jgi:hypothetical protein